jgi:hypothetical protein
VTDDTHRNKPCTALLLQEGEGKINTCVATLIGGQGQGTYTSNLGGSGSFSCSKQNTGGGSAKKAKNVKESCKATNEETKASSANPSDEPMDVDNENIGVKISSRTMIVEPIFDSFYQEGDCSNPGKGCDWIWTMVLEDVIPELVSADEEQITVTLAHDAIVSKILIASNHSLENVPYLPCRPRSRYQLFTVKYRQELEARGEYMTTETRYLMSEKWTQVKGNPHDQYFQVPSRMTFRH